MKIVGAKTSIYQIIFNCFINDKRFTSLDKKNRFENRNRKTRAWLRGNSLSPISRKWTNDEKKARIEKKKRHSLTMCKLSSRTKQIFSIPRCSIRKQPRCLFQAQKSKSKHEAEEMKIRKEEVKKKNEKKL